MIRMQIVGRLTKDVELKYLPNGTAIGEASVASSNVYKDRNTGERKEETTFIDVKVFGKMAETMNQYLHKGDQVCFIGDYKVDKWQAQDGTNRYKSYCLVREMEFINCKKDGQNNNNNQPQQNNSYQQQSAPQQPQQDIPTIDIDDEDIPF